MQAKDVMTEDVVCLHVSASIFEAAELMVGAGVSAVPVIDGEGKLIGIVSEADLMRRDTRGRYGVGGIAEDEDPLSGEIGRIDGARVPGQPRI